MKTTGNILMIIISALALTGCSTGAKAGHISRTELHFDTAVTIDLYGPDEDRLIEVMDECMGLCDHYEKLFNKNDKTSDIYAINSSGRAGVKVDHDTALMLSDSLRYCRSSDGMFDISVKPLSDLWDFHEESGNIPDTADIDDALSRIDYRNISVDADDVVTVPEGVAIDPGGAAKGYIADRIAERVRTSGAEGAIINIGGDIKIIGTKDKNRPFIIGVRDPFDKNDVVAALEVTDMAVATSGTYERCFTVDDKRYHHILDTKTGYPVNTDIESATVITKDAVDADCLCTVCILYGSSRAKELIEQTDDTEAIFVLSDGSVVMTKNAASYIRQ